MTADRQPRQPPGQWPYPADDLVTRARKIAGMYRAALGTTNPAMRDQCDQTAASFGETWMLDRLDVIDPDQALTTTQAAELVRRTPKTIREWACRPHPDKPGQPLLPRFRMRGRERTYLAQDVLAAANAVARQQHAQGRSC